MGRSLSIRLSQPTDCPALYGLCHSGNHPVDPDDFETAHHEQIDGKRHIFLAFLDNDLVGYAYLNAHPLYTPFARLSIPEIQDVFVHPDARRCGVGAELIAACEAKARACGSDTIGIGVGVAGKFGSAQRLYARMGYLPDGAGVVFDRTPVATGDVRPIDDRLCLMLIKSL